jgi:hypothetical protein
VKAKFPLPALVVIVALSPVVLGMGNCKRQPRVSPESAVTPARIKMEMIHAEKLVGAVLARDSAVAVKVDAHLEVEVNP